MTPTQHPPNTPAVARTTPAPQGRPPGSGAAKRTGQAARPSRRRRTTTGYVELRAASAFSFLDGASQPEDLATQAAALDLPALALIDRNGVYGAPRFYRAAREAGIRPLVGAEIVLGTSDANDDGDEANDDGHEASPRRAKQRGTRREASRRGIAAERLTVLVRDRRGYRNLCRLLTTAARGRSKGDAFATWEQVRAHARGLHCLTGGGEGPLARRLRGPEGMVAGQRVLAQLRDAFEGNVHVELQRTHQRHEEHRNQALVALGQRLRLPVVATGGVRYARPADKTLYDVLTCARHGTRLDAAGRRLDAGRLRHLHSPTAMAARFADLPAALAESVHLAGQLDFTLADLGYRFPTFPLPPGESAASYLRQLTWNGARARFRPFTARAQAQIAKELDMIEKLGLAGYFLIVWDLVRFCAEQQIMAQGRGSAANSAVCYALSITAVDPVKMELLFERFLSEERGEWPDIDLDLPSGSQREKVIQYVYQRYGPHGAAMTANVITYRDRLAAREVGKALGFSTEQLGQLSKQLGRWRYDARRGDHDSVNDRLRAARFDPKEPRVRRFTDLWQRLQNLPRHLGQHSGGMVVAHGRLDEVVPLEPASMPGRVVVQWDKDDLADLGIIKIDLLGLGMLNALEEAVPLIRCHERTHVELAHLPPDDPKTYRMLRAADTVGVFQVESRAQMASLPRNAPRTFYDLVIQVAIIRPGPIVGGMVNPFFERRRGRAEVVYAHPSLEPILARTLGVPLFQEQLLRIAMVAAGFTGGEAEELRRAMGFKRSAERMAVIERRLRAGMTERGIAEAAQDQIVKSITSFALYGFPESHAASFALIAYASAYLKAHHPTAFLIALLNASPMGFYHPATLIQDAQRHGVTVLPVDVRHSRVRCTWEEPTPAQRAQTARRAGPRVLAAAGGVRLGLRYVRGLQRERATAIVAARDRRPFEDLADFTHRSGLREHDLERLAHAGALAGFGLSRRAALWQVARLGRSVGPLLAETDHETPGPSPLPEMAPLESTVADYRATGLTTGVHPVAYVRPQLNRRRVVTIAALDQRRPGTRVRFAGAVIVRQRPGTAKGMLFVTLEDETGMAQALIVPSLLDRHRQVVVGAAGLVIEGTLEKRDGTLSVKASHVWPLERFETAPSHDFH